MATSVTDAMSFCRMLHDRISASLCNVTEVRSRVDMLRQQNSFAESCFCKACVLPAVDAVITEFLTTRFNATRQAVRHALRCEGFATPMYVCDATQVGFSSHSRSNSYHPGDKSGRRASSRRSPDFCIRYAPALRVVGEMKYVERASSPIVMQVVNELRDYLSVRDEPTSDWGHDFGWGLVYGFGGTGCREAQLVTKYWGTDRIALSVFAAT